MSKNLRLRDVIALTGLSKTTIHRLEAAGRFPRRRKVGLRAVAWLASEIEAWQAAGQQVSLTCKAARGLA